MDAMEEGASGPVPAKTFFGRVASNFAWSIVSEAFGKGVFFFSNIYLARVLGVENFGYFAVAQALTYYFWLAVDLGTNMYGIKEIARRKEHAEEIINPLFTLRITSGLLVFALYSLTVILFVNDNRAVFIASGLYLVTYSLNLDWMLKGFERFSLIALGSFISSLAFLAGTVSLVRSSVDLDKAALVWALSFLLGNLSMLAATRTIKIRLALDFRLSLWVRHLRESIYFTASGAFMMLYQYLPIFLLSVLFTSREVGLFSAPYKIVFALCSIGFYVPMAFYPVMAELHGKGGSGFMESHRRLKLLMLLMGVPVGFWGVFFGDYAIGLLLGSEYMESAPAFRVLLWLVPLYFLRYSYGITLSAMGWQKLNARISALCLLTMAVLGTTLTYFYGIMGCSVGLLVSEGVYIAAQMYHVKKWTVAADAV